MLILAVQFAMVASLFARCTTMMWLALRVARRPDLQELRQVSGHDGFISARTFGGRLRYIDLPSSSRRARVISYRCRVAAGAATLLALLVSSAVRSVNAHSELVASSPPPGAVVTIPPTEVEIEFSGPLAITSTIQVQDEYYQLMQAVDAVTLDPANPRVMRIPVKPLNDGSFTVQWTAVSPFDGHRITGSYEFAVRTGSSWAQGKGAVTSGADDAENGGLPSTFWIAALSVLSLALAVFVVRQRHGHLVNTNRKG